MSPLVLTAEQRKAAEQRRKKTLDRRIYQRLTAVLTVSAGHSREDIAHLLGVDLVQLDQWLLVFRTDGLDALCTLAVDQPSSSNS